MDQSLAIGISVGAVYVLVVVLGKRFRISSKYERGSKTLNTWSAQDQGLDQSTEADHERS